MCAVQQPVIIGGGYGGGYYGGGYGGGYYGGGGYDPALAMAGGFMLGAALDDGYW